MLEQRSITVKYPFNIKAELVDCLLVCQ